MGKDWYWPTTSTASAAKSSKRPPPSSAGGVGEGATPRPRPRNRPKPRDRDTTSASASASGSCITAVFQFFDFHHFHFCLHHPPSSLHLPHENHSTVLKGTEAPRNSLELELQEDKEEGEVSVLVSSSKQDHQKLHLPMEMEMEMEMEMDMQIKTRCRGHERRSSNELYSSGSPGTKTPTLVARLMGLDLLPDSCSSPSSSSTVSSIHAIATPTSNYKKSHLNRLRQGSANASGTRSLPETPRVSSSSSRRSVDADHRLSLQIHKENLTEALEFSRFTSQRRKEIKCQDENRSSPSEYAKQIVKQVKESVSRRVGLTDITNTSSVSRNREQRRDQELLISHLKSKKCSKPVSTKLGEDSSPGKNSTVPSCSPRLRFLESKNKPTATNTNCQSQAMGPLQEQQKEAKKCSKKVAGGERFRSRLIKKPPQTSDIIRKNSKQEEPFVRPSSTAIMKANSNIPEHNKCKKTPLSSDLLNPTLLPVKKDPAIKIVLLQNQSSQVSDADADAARESRRRSQLSSCASQKYKQATRTHSVPDNNSNHNKLNGDDDATSATTGGGGADHHYVTTILNRTGIHKDAPVSFAGWFSPSHPLDPSLFHQLELSHHHHYPAAATAATDRKLLFHVVDELLVDILRPYVNMKPWRSFNKSTFGVMHGSELADVLCRKIRSFPAKDCRVLEDIDEIIDGDLPEWKVRNVERLGMVEEGESIVREIEKEVLDTLVGETAAVAMSCGRFGGGRNGAVWMRR